MRAEEFFGTGNDIKPARLQPEHETSIENWRDAIRAGQIAFSPEVDRGKPVLVRVRSHDAGAEGAARRSSTPGSVRPSATCPGAEDDCTRRIRSTPR